MVKHKNDPNFEIRISKQNGCFHNSMLKYYMQRNNVLHAGLVATENKSKHEDVVFAGSLNEMKLKELVVLPIHFVRIFPDLPGRINVLECHLNALGDTPIHVKQYPIPYAAENQG